MAEQQAPGQWSATVVRAGRGDDPVAAGAVIRPILDAHASDYAPGVRPVWPEATAPRKTPSEWIRQVEPLFTTNVLFGRLVVVGLAVLDAAVGEVALRSGLLWRVAGEVEPSLEQYLTPSGRRLMQRRQPLIAASLGIATPEQTRVRTGPAVAVAFPPGGAPAWTGVGRYAGAWTAPGSIEIEIVRDGASETRTDITGKGVGLAWRGRSLLIGGDDGLTVLSPDGNPELMKAWGPVKDVAATPSSDTIAVLGADGILRTGPVGPQPPAPSGPSALALAAAPDSDAIVYSSPTGTLLSQRLGAGGQPTQLPSSLSGPATIVACGPGGSVAAAAPGGMVEVHRQPATPPASESPSSPGQSPSSASGSPSSPSGSPSSPSGSPFSASGSPSFASGSPASISPSTLPVPPVFVGEATAIALGPDALLAVARAAPDGGTVVSLYLDGFEIASLRHPVRVGAVAFRSDGAFLASACDDGQIRIWRLAPTSTELRFGHYDADVSDGEDLLHISSTVNALAALAAARQTVPPLSVGLFGPWGSGKTFFMRKLKQRIDEIAADASVSAQPQSDLWAWRSVRQIWFNAWNYAGGDVWAGLVEHLIAELAGAVTELPKPDALQELHVAKLQALAEATARHEKAQQEATDAAEELGALEESVAEARDDVAKAKEAEQVATEKLEEAATRSPPVLEGTAEALEAVGVDSGAAKLPAAMGGLWAELMRRRTRLAAGAPADRKRRWRLAGAVVVGPAVAVGVGLAASALSVELPGLLAAAAGLAAGINAVLAWLQKQARWEEDQLRELTDAAEAARTAMIETEVELARAQRTHADTRRELQLRQERLRGAQESEALARAAANRSTPEQLFSDYLGDRAASEDYRGRLGILGLVRRDLDAITEAMTKHNEALIAPGAPPGNGKTINRIVLYVDDLDRCPPKVVVQVLEAVHLLLAYPMFVVVVAVDPQWVGRSIAATYPDLFSDDKRETGAHVTAEDYLEKIFQIPIWLDPLRAETAQDMLTGLMRAEQPEDGSDAGVATTASEPGPSLTAAGAGAAAAQPTADGSVAVENLAESPPTTLTLTGEERRGIEGLAALLTRSPRAVKRYLNTYRLLKAETDPDDLRAVQAVLALAVHRDDDAAALLDRVELAPASSTLEGLLTGAAPLTSQPLRDYVGAETSCGRLAPVIAKVRRFTFRVSPGEPPGRAAPGR